MSLSLSSSLAACLQVRGRLPSLISFFRYRVRTSLDSHCVSLFLSLVAENTPRRAFAKSPWSPLDGNEVIAL